MQQTKLSFLKKCKLAITGSGWVMGLLLAGSENPYMPWVNVIGLLILLVASLVLGKGFRQLGNKDRSDSKSHQIIDLEKKKVKQAYGRTRQNRAVSIRYA